MSMIMTQFPEARGYRVYSTTNCKCNVSTRLYPIEIFTLGPKVQSCNCRKRSLMITCIRGREILPYNFGIWKSGLKPGVCTYLLTNLLTYSMVQSPSWEANWFAASQEIPRISWNPKVHYRTHKRPPTVSILVQSNSVHIPTSHLLEIHPNIIHPSTPRSPQWFPSLRFPHQDPIHPPLLTHTRHMPSPSHSSRFYHPRNTGWRVQII